MTMEEFRASLAEAEPPQGLSTPLTALWWDAKGESAAGESGCRAQAHGLVDALETKDGMAVHAYLHRKEGARSNAEYWYERAGREHRREALSDEWQALVEALLSA
jgi:hypothetical protein